MTEIMQIETDITLHYPEVTNDISDKYNMSKK